jgi:hypothetical protein
LMLTLLMLLLLMMKDNIPCTQNHPPWNSSQAQGWLVRKSSAETSCSPHICGEAHVLEQHNCPPHNIFRLETMIQTMSLAVMMMPLMVVLMMPSMMVVSVLALMRVAALHFVALVHLMHNLVESKDHTSCTQNHLPWSATQAQSWLDHKPSAQTYCSLHICGEAHELEQHTFHQHNIFQ